MGGWKQSHTAGPSLGSSFGNSIHAYGDWRSPGAHLLIADPAPQHTPAAGIALSTMRAAYKHGNPSLLAFLIPAPASPPDEGPDVVSAAGDLTPVQSTLPHVRVIAENAASLPTVTHTALEGAASGGVRGKQTGSAEAGRLCTNDLRDKCKECGAPSATESAAVKMTDAEKRQCAGEGPPMPQGNAGPSDRRRALMALHRELDSFTARDFFLERFVMGGRLHRRCGGA